MAAAASGTAWETEAGLVRSAMYWQLHLAYDRDYSYKHYRNYQETCESLFFARVSSYARNPASAPTGIALSLSGDQDQVFMRLASSAAQRNLTEFFMRWGLVPDEETSAYMAQYTPEERPIYYLDDSARAYVLEQMAAGKDVILEIEIQGALKVKERFPDTLLLFVTPPSAAELERRLRKRGTETEEKIAERLKQAENELAAAENYDYLIVNGELEKAVDDIMAVMRAEKLRRSRNAELVKEIKGED